MTDKEIKKGLECCIEWETPEDCGKCPYKDAKGCVTAQRKDALDLINRQQAEIERLQDIIDNGAVVCHNCHSKYAEKIKQAKAEAIKEFAERLKEEYFTERFCGQKYDLIHDWIDNLVKEMVGEDK